MFKDINLQKKYLKEFGKKKIKSWKSCERLQKSNRLVLKSLSYGRINSLALESCRQTIKKNLKKQGKILFRVFPYISLHEKPAEVRMGRGKGGRFRGWYAFVKPGDVILELEGTNILVGKLILHQAAKKLPLKMKVSECLFL